MLSYQLCNYSVTQSVQKVEAVQVSHVTYAPCGGWIPWRRCPKTVYRTRYLAVAVPESRNVTDCCEGYEQLGLYCVLRECRVGRAKATPHFLLLGVLMGLRGGGLSPTGPGLTSPFWNPGSPP